MNFIPLASSSKGNAYLVTSPGVDPLLLEAGIPIKQLREKLHFGISGLAGCLISHEHGDHSKAVKDLLRAGVNIISSRGTAKALDIENHYRFICVEAGVALESGWMIRPVPLEHDAAEPTGFFIKAIENDDRLLFIPDTGYTKNRFMDVNILAIECNNLEEKLSDSILNGNLPAVAGRRIRRNHLSLERLITMLKSNDLSQCRQIYLLHLSDGNSHEKKMVEAVQSVTGIPCYVCEE